MEHRALPSDVEGALLRRPALPQAPSHAYVEMLFRRRWTIAAVLVACMLGALIYVIATPRAYKATSAVVIEPGNTKLTDLNQLVLSLIAPPENPNVINTLAEVVRSHTVVGNAVAKLGVPPGQRERRIVQILKRLEVETVENTSMIKISAQGPTPAAAAATTNAIADSFSDWNLQQQRASATAGRMFIEAQVRDVQARLHDMEARLASFQADHNQLSLDQPNATLISQFAALQARAQTLDAQIQGDTVRLAQARTILAREASSPSPIQASADPTVAALRDQLGRLQVELIGLKQQFTPKAPQVMAVQAQIDALKQQLQQAPTAAGPARLAAVSPLAANVQSQMVTLELNLQAERAERQSVGATLSEYEGRIQKMPPVMVSYADLARDVKIQEASYQGLLQKLYEAKITEESVLGTAVVVDRAVPPSRYRPVRPQPLLAGVFSLLMGLGFGTGIAYGMEALDTSIKTPEEAERLLGLPILGVIPLIEEPGEQRRRKIRRLRKPGRQQRHSMLPRRRRQGERRSLPLMVSNAKAPVADAFRYLRTNLLYISPDQPLKRLLVVSAGPGEGKSTVAINLAIVLAQLNRRVWLVEGDLRKSTFAWVFKLPTVFGLTELLCQQGVSLAQAVHQTSVDNVSVIPAGAQPPNPTELLGSRKMQSLLAGHDEVDCLILDSPPVLALADAALLTPHMDGVIVVVRAGVTPRAAAKRACELLEMSGARIIGVVVNGMHRLAGYSSYFGHSYGYYGYGYGYGDAVADDTSAGGSGGGGES